MWTGLFCFMVFVIFLAIGDMISTLTKSRFSGLLAAMILYLIGFQTGIIPADAVSSTGLVTIAGGWAIALLLVGMGTMMDIKTLVSQWKTVTIALAGLAGLAIATFTVSSMIVGREWAYAAAGPISGGIVAGNIIAEAGNAAGRPDSAAFAFLIIGVQGFIGMPICSNLLKSYTDKIISGDIVMQDLSGGDQTEKPKLIKSFPKFMQSDNNLLARLAVTAYFGYVLSAYVTKGKVNFYVMCLFVGILAYAIGWLPKNAHIASHGSSILMLCVMSICFGNLATISLEDLAKMVLPLIVTLLVGAAFVVGFGFIIGKILKVDWRLCGAIAICCTIGYPGTGIICDEVSRSLECDPELRAKITEHITPPIIISGFTSVTIASVIFAGIMAPLIFK